MSNKIKGFTLIELLVVVAIIGILAAVGVVAYSGYVEGTKMTKCKDQHKIFKKEILRKWRNVDLKTTCDVVEHSGFCWLHWLPSNTQHNAHGTDICAAIAANNTSHPSCYDYYQGSEAVVYDHFYGLGYRNPFTGDPYPAVISPSRNNNQVVGTTRFACGANASLSDPFECKLTTMCELGKYTEAKISSKN